jgi:hypothetical protein
MQKPSETLYASLFWLISALFIWLLILPIAVLSLPLMLLVTVGKLIFTVPKLNLTETEITSPENREHQPVNANNPLLDSLLMASIIKLPAILASVISLQPTRSLNKQSLVAESIQPQAAETQRNSSLDTIDIPAEEKTGGN